MRRVALALALTLLACGPASALELKIAQGALDGDTTDGIASWNQ